MNARQNLIRYFHPGELTAQLIPGLGEIGYFANPLASCAH